MKRAAWSLLAFFAMAIAAYAFTFLAIGEAMYPPPLKASFLARPWGIQPHALFGGVGLIAGVLQFARAIRRRLPLHRLLGRIYVIACLITGLAGLYMAAYSFGGWVTHAGFGALAVLLLVTTISGYLAIRSRRIDEHRAWMTRSYALMLAAVTLRIELPLLIAFFGEFASAYLIVSWLCWVPNLIAGEMIVRSARRASSRETGVRELDLHPV